MLVDNLVQRLRRHATSIPNHVALRFLASDDVTQELTFAELDERVRALAALFQRKDAAGQRAVILLPSGPDYAVAFYACLYSGVIAVPAYPLERNTERHASRLEGIFDNAEPRFVLTSTVLREQIGLGLPEGFSAEIIEVDSLPITKASEWRDEPIAADEIAFLQYTSGSTSQPKGVCVSHGNLVANERAIQAAYSATAADIMVSWLPLYHDMGLIGSLLNPLFVGYTLVLMSPQRFFERPRRWLEAISKYRGTISGGPDFAYALCADRISAQSAVQFDLKSWRIAFSGSEFVRLETIHHFTKKFAPAEFNSGAFTPSYGLAEATLLVSHRRSGNEIISITLDSAELAADRVVDGKIGTSFLQCGFPIEEHTVRIVRKDGSTATEREVGEIWVSGPSIAVGYWRNAQATEKTFVYAEGRRWLRTGDVGFLRDNALTITGRLKDIIIIRGQNIYPTDIERSIEAEVRAVRGGRVAAFPVEIEGQESIGVAAEFSRAVLRRESPEELAREIGEAVLRQAQDYPAVILLLNPRGMPLTTSGKLQRSACSARWADKTLDTFMVFERGRRHDDGANPQEGQAPQTSTERAVAPIWRDVLDVESVARDEDFFVLGGNSIAAGQIAAAIRERLGVEVALRSFFDFPTLAALCGHIDGLAAEGLGRSLAPIPRAMPEARTVLSHAQERLWFLWNMDPGGAAYTVACTIRLRGRLDADVMARALTEIVCRHESLRTTFSAEDGRPRQVIHPSVDVDMRREDLRAQPLAWRASLVVDLVRTELAKPFDLIAGPLLRAVLVQIDDDEHELLLSAHHISVDGWSLDILMNEMADLYRSFGRAGVGSPPVPMIQYADFAAWQRNWLAAEAGSRQLTYWKEKLGDVQPLLALPFDRPRPSVQSYRGDTVTLPISSELAARLRDLAGRNRASVFMLMLAAYQTLLYRYTGQSDLRVGVPVAGRRHAQIERLIGCFVNTLVMKAEITERMTFAQLLAQVRDTSIEALAHQDIPFEQVVDGLRVQRSAGHNPLFQAKFNYMTAPAGFEAVDGLAADAKILDLAGSHFDLALDIVDGANGMTAAFNFATDLFDNVTIKRLADQYVSFLDQIVNDADRPLADLTIAPQNLCRVESETMAFVATDVIALYRAASAGRADAVAVRCGSSSMTFGELNRRSGSLAQELAVLGVERDVPVAVWLDRSCAFVSSVLAILRAGGAYVPLDPKWPLQRVHGIVRDGGISVVIAAGETLAAAQDLGCRVIDADAQIPMPEQNDHSADTGIHPEQTAYVIYTSGSTGTPKGVAVSHGALANYVQALIPRAQLSSRSNMAMVSTVAADLGHTVLFGALATGATLNLLSSDALFDADLFSQAMRKGDVDVLKIVPSHLRGLLQASASADLLPRDLLVLGGEACDADLLAEVRRRRPQCRIVNHYGPTETTVGAVTYAFAEAEFGAIPIGMPLANMRAYVLDRDLNEVPAGVQGELYLGGKGLARGYRRAAGLTAGRFVPDPFGHNGERLYRTGDVVRRDASGCLVFMGRADHQIKLRGYRIELEEIARTLRTLEGIGDAVVVARATGVDQRQELVAYCVMQPGVRLDADAIRHGLSALLPDYMVPVRFVNLPRLPLTPNGKIDHKALPLVGDNVSAAAHAAPEGDIEQTIAAVWQEVLGLERVGRTDNFFELGGDSILSLQIISRLRKRGIRLTPKQVFAQQTVAALAALVAVGLSSATKNPAPARKTSAAAGAAEHQFLLPIQERFFAQDIAERHHFNQALLLSPREPIDTERLRQALRFVLGHHEALRTQFVPSENGWRAVVRKPSPDSDVLWTREGVAGPAEVTEAASSAQQSLSLRGDLFRAVAMNLADGGQRLLLAAHHLVIDGMSWRVLLEDLSSAYEQLGHGVTDVVLTPAGDSSTAWASRLRTHASSTALLQEIPFWLEQTAAADVPCDRNPGEVERVGDSAEASVVLDAAFTSKLLASAPSAYRTQINDILLAALSRALWQWGGLDEAVIELEGHGREDIFTDIDISRTIGWFTTAFPFRLPKGSMDDGALVKSVKEALRSVPHRGLGYGVLRHLGDEAVRKTLAQPADPKIVFNYLGRFDGSVGEGLPFDIAPESAGPMRGAGVPMRAWLTINGEIRGGCLRFSFQYGKHRYDAGTVEKLARAYEAALREIVEHCVTGAGGITPSDVPLSGLSQSDLDHLGSTFDWRSVEDIYPLSPLQQGLLFRASRDGDADPYVNQAAFDLTGVDPCKLRAAWQAVSDRHAALRTGFIWRELSGVAQQIVYRDVVVPFAEDDWRALAAEDPDRLDKALTKIAAEDGARIFDLGRPPLQFIRLVRIGVDRYRMIWTHHHIFLDGWSSARLLAEVMQHMSGSALPPSPGNYSDYIAWLQARDRAASEAFWLKATAALEAPTFLADTGGQVDALSRESRSIRHSFTLDRDLTDRLTTFIRRERVTLNTLVQGAWARLLRRYSGQDAVCFGVTVAGRPADLAGAEETVGLFINTLPMIDNPHPAETAGDWLRQLQDENIGLREHEWMPLFEIQRLAGFAGRRLFDTILVFENYPVDLPLLDGQGDGPRIGNVRHVTPSEYPLAVAVFAEPGRLHFDFNYDNGYFDAARILDFESTLVQMLQSIVGSAGQAFGTLGTLNAGEAIRVLDRSGPDGVAALSPRTPRLTVVDRIEKMARQSPLSVALIHGDDFVTYAELSGRANALANRLRHHGIGPDALVGVALSRTPKMIEALLAILKAGGAYLPLDPDYPAERLEYMLRDSGARLVLTEDEHHDRIAPMLRDTGVEAWRLQDRSIVESNDNRRSGVGIHPDSLAYVIYTSGSTGRPKGVAVAHGPLAMHCESIAQLYGMQASDRELQTASINFDIAHERWLVPLMSGGALVLPAKRNLSIDDLLGEIAAHAVTSVFLPPAYAAQLSAVLMQAGKRMALRLCVVGGEAWSDAGVKSFRQAASVAQLFNAYGPTETVVAPMAWPVNEADLVPGRAAPIGRPVGARTVYILDGNLNPVSPGVTGELFIGSLGLARGYLNRAALTSERFVPNPFAGDGARIYRTGDLVRWRGDGTIDYVGRADSQVKIRGFRIELGEIEARLMERRGVRLAAVIARDAGSGRQLIGYVSGDEGLDGGALRSALAAVLPEYMVPSFVAVLAQMPLTPNGKIDRRALPQQDDAIHRLYIAPETEMECAMAAIWADLLGQDRIGCDDHFFDLGGQSLLAMRLVSRVAMEWNVTIQLSDLFKHPKLSEFARFVSIRLIEQEFDEGELQSVIASGAPQ